MLLWHVEARRTSVELAAVRLQGSAVVDVDAIALLGRAVAFYR